MALPATDNFNRANGALGTNWTGSYGNDLAISSNTVTGTTTNADNSMYWSADSPDAAQYAQLKMISMIGSYAGPLVRCNATQWVVGQAWGNDKWDIEYCNNGSYTQIGSDYTTDPVANDVARITASGTTFTLYINSTSRISGSNASAPSTGGGGVYIFSNTSAYWDDFEVGNLTAGNPAAAVYSSSTLTDSVTVQIPRLYVSKSDTSTLADAIIVSEPRLYASATDTATVTDTISSKAGNAISNVSDTSTVQETITFSIISPPNGISISETTTTGETIMIKTFSPYSTLVESFNDDSFDTSVWNTEVTGTGTILEQNKRLEFTPENSEEELYFMSNNWFSIQASYISVEVDLQGTSNATNIFEVRLYGFNSVYINLFRITNETLYAVEDGDVYTVIASTAYSAVNHRFLRFREAEGTLYWDTSPDGTNWSNFTSKVLAALEITQRTTFYLYDYYEGFGTKLTPYADNINIPTPTVSDTASIVESISTVAGAGQGSASSASTLADTITLYIGAFNAIVSDTATLADVIDGKAGDAVANVVDTVTVGESIEFDISDLVISVSDTATLSDSITPVGGAGVAVVTDTLTIGEEISFDISDLNVAVVDVSTVGEAILFDISDLSILVTDTATVGDVPTVLEPQLYAEVTDTTTIIETIISVGGGGVAIVTETVTINEAILSKGGDGVAEVYDVVTTGETISISEETTITDYDVTITDTVTANDIPTADIPVNVSVADISTLADEIGSVAGSAVAEVSDTVTVGELILFDISDLGVYVSETVTTGEAISFDISDLNISVTDTSTLADEVTVNQTPNVEITDVVTVGELILFDIADLSIYVSDTSTLTDLIDSKAGDGQAVVTDTVTVGESISFDISDLSIAVVDVCTVVDVPEVSEPQLYVVITDVTTAGELIVFDISDVSISVSDTSTLADEIVSVAGSGVAVLADVVTADDVVTIEQTLAPMEISMTNWTGVRIV